jgi:hypothetical protein
MPDGTDGSEVAEAIRELARQVDTLGNAVISAARTIAEAIEKRPNERSSGVSDQGTFT